MIPFTDLPDPATEAAPAESVESAVCRRCHRQLRDPVSLGYRIGPDCRDHLGIPRPQKPPRIGVRWSGPVEGQTDLMKINEGERTMTKALEALAPYPEHAADVTADRLVRYFTAFAYLHARIALHSDDKEQVKASANLLVQTYGLAATLRELIAVSPETSEKLARDLWESWDGGEALALDLVHWLTEYGISPVAVDQEAQKIAEESR